MRYLIALVVSLALIGIGTVFIRYTRSTFQVRHDAAMKEIIKEQGIDPNKGEPVDFGLEMSPSEMRMLK